MGDRGPAPRREDEVRRTNNKGTATKLGRAELQDLPFKVDLDPDPLEAPDHWHEMAKSVWEGLKTDPARAWMTSADWATTMVVIESLSRDLQPQVVGVTETGEVVKDMVPMKGANQTSFLRHMASLGVTEQARLRMSKEITLFKSKPIDTEGNVVDISTARRNEVQ